MPLEAGDLEKIQSMIDKSTDKLDRKIDAVLPGLITQRDADVRFTSIIERVVRTETSLQKMAEWILAETEKARNSVQEKFDKTMAAIAEVQKSIDTVKDERAQDQKVNYRTIIGYLVSALLGGGVVQIVLHFLGK